MHTSYFKKGALITIATLTVNILLFTGLPNILPKQSVETDVMGVQAVNFIRQKQGRDMNEENHKPEKTEPPEPPRKVPSKAVNHMVQPTHQQLEMDMPAFNFDMPTDMAMGVAVDAPRAALPKSTLKDFYGMKDVDQTPVATLKTTPAYPYRARRLNLNGEVDVKFLVDTTGRVSRISILRATPSGLFDDSVLRSLAAWRFTPGKVKGQPVNTWVTTTISFRIDDL